MSSDAGPVTFIKKRKGAPAALRKKLDSPSAPASSSSSTAAARDEPATSEVVHATKRSVTSHLFQGTGTKRRRTQQDDGLALSDSDDDTAKAADERERKAFAVRHSSDRHAERRRSESPPAWVSSDQIKEMARDKEAVPDEVPDDGLYRGASKQKNQVPKATGPVKGGPGNVRTITLTDYQPDVCKDYKGASLSLSLSLSLLLSLAPQLTHLPCMQRPASAASATRARCVLALFLHPTPRADPVPAPRSPAVPARPRRLHARLAARQLVPVQLDGVGLVHGQAARARWRRRGRLGLGLGRRRPPLCVLDLPQAVRQRARRHAVRALLRLDVRHQAVRQDGQVLCVRRGDERRLQPVRPSLSLYLALPLSCSLSLGISVRVPDSSFRAARPSSSTSRRSARRSTPRRARRKRAREPVRATTTASRSRGSPKRVRRTCTLRIGVEDGRPRRARTRRATSARKRRRSVRGSGPSSRSSSREIGTVLQRCPRTATVSREGRGPRKGGTAAQARSSSSLPLAWSFLRSEQPPML